MPDLRPGELIVQTAGGRCPVCRQRIAPGPAVQLSADTARCRHLECLPKGRDKREYMLRKLDAADGREARSHSERERREDRDDEQI